MDSQKKETIIRKVLKNEIGQVISIIAIVYSFVMLIIIPIKAIEYNIKTINENHIVHIQDDISTIKSYIDKNEDEKKLMWMQVERTATIMEQHLEHDK